MTEQMKETFTGVCVAVQGPTMAEEHNYGKALENSLS